MNALPFTVGYALNATDPQTLETVLAAFANINDALAWAEYRSTHMVVGTYRVRDGRGYVNTAYQAGASR